MRKIRIIFRCLIALVLLTVGMLCVSHRLDWEKHVPAIKHEPVTVMTWNTHMMGHCRPAEQNEVLAYLKTHPADIVCLQEAQVAWNEDRRHLSLHTLKSELSAYYPYTYVDFKQYHSNLRTGNIVFSRYPLIHKQTIPYPSVGNISSRCDVVVHGDTLRLIINHLESNRLVAEDWVDSLSTDEVRRASSQISRKLSKASEIRKVQARIIRDEIDQSPYPVICAGDMNMLPLSYEYLRIRFGRKAILRDTFLEGSRWQLGTTCAFHHIGVRIDYIFSSRSIRTIRSTVDKDVTASDHYPLWTTLCW